METKAGDIIEFLAISWDVPEWEFDHPTAVLKPHTAYSPNGESCEGMIEDMAINMSCGKVENEDIEDQLNWISTSLKTLNRVAKNRLNGKDDWKSKIREVVLQKVEFYEQEGELYSRVIETTTA